MAEELTIKHKREDFIELENDIKSWKNESYNLAIDYVYHDIKENE
jgi:hypothetical protein